MARLATVVHVTDDKGVNHAFGPADEVPEWAQALITNPKAWAEAPVAQNVLRDSSSAPVAKPAAKRVAPRRKAAGSGTVQ
jgi:hypothetical protein